MKKQNSIKKDKKSVKVFGYVGVFASFLMAAFVVTYIWSPVVGINADSTAGARSKISAAITRHSSLAISGNADFNLELTPEQYNSSGDSPSFCSDEAGCNYDVEYKDIELTYDSNNADGFSIYFSSVDENTDLVNSANSNFMLTSPRGFCLSDDILPDDQEWTDDSWNYSPLNLWGFETFAPGSDPYDQPTCMSAIPKLSQQREIVKSKDYNNEKTLAVRLAVRAGLDLPAGDYSKDIVFTLVPNDFGEEYDPIDETTGECNDTRTLFDISTMQQMNSCVCNNTETPTSSYPTVLWEDDYRSGRYSYYSPGQLAAHAILRDIRDGNEYLVVKIGTGQCIMAQNLALDLSADDNWNLILTPRDSDLNTISSYEPVDHDEKNVDFAKAPAGKEYFNSGYTPSSTMGSSGRKESIYQKTGYYYRWSTATLHTKDDDKTSEPNDSICPRGWRMMNIADANGIFNTYGWSDSNMGSARGSNAKTYFMTAGYMNGGTLSSNSTSSTDGYGYFLLRDRTSTYNVSTILLKSGRRTSEYVFKPNSAASSYYTDENNEYNVRCVAR